MSSERRKMGGTIKQVRPMNTSELRVRVLKDVGQAVELVDIGFKLLMKHKPKKYSAMLLKSGEWKTSLRKGMPERMDKIMAKSEELIAEAIAYDNRLVRRAAFKKSDDPSAACGFDAAAIAAGEEAPYYSRPHRKLNSDRAWGEAVRIVISTDTKDITDDNAAAAIAAARIAQQFRPLEIWWQGAWLEVHPKWDWCRIGTVFLVPILSGDLDFSRIQFVLSHQNRDNLSHKVAWAISDELVDGQTSMIAGLRATESYHPERTDHFVPESGIHAWDTSVAGHAAAWAGFEHKYHDNVDPNCAVQKWAPEDPNAKPAQPTEEDKKRWAKRDAEHKAKTAKDKDERMAIVETEL